MRDNVLAEILALKGLSRRDLEKKYTELHDGAQPPSGNRQFLFRRLAYRIQELAYGGLSEEAQGKIQTLIKEYDPVNRLLAKQQEKSKKEEAKPSRDRRLPIPGTEITKHYKGRTIRVKVLEKGFEFENARYKTLTAIAKKVTGSHWNGYLFFGLRRG